MQRALAMKMGRQPSQICLQCLRGKSIGEEAERKTDTGASHVLRKVGWPCE